MKLRVFLCAFLLTTSNTQAAGLAGFIFKPIKEILDMANSGVTLANNSLDFYKLDFLNHEENQKITYDQTSNKVHLSLIDIESSRGKEELDRRESLANEQRKLAEELLKNKKYTKAALKYRDSLENNAEDEKSWHGYGQILSEIGYYDEAQNAYFMALGLNSDAFLESRIWQNLGKNFTRQKRYKDAITSYKESLKFNEYNNEASEELERIRKIKFNNNYYKYRVNAKHGIRLRSKPSQTKSKILKNIPLNTEIKFIRYVGKKTMIENISSQWAEVDYKGTKGYVFGGFIAPINSNQNDFDSNYKPEKSYSPNLYRIQLGVFSSEENASSYRDSLELSNNEVNIRFSSDKALYFLEIKDLESKSEAYRVLEELQSVNYTSDFLIKKQD